MAPPSLFQPSEAVIQRVFPVQRALSRYDADPTKYRDVSRAALQARVRDARRSLPRGVVSFQEMMQLIEDPDNDYVWTEDGVSHDVGTFVRWGIRWPEQESYFDFSSGRRTYHTGVQLSRR